jgi:hypothetical protein
MGSFSIYYDERDINSKKVFEKEVCSFQFSDEDGVVVIVTLNLDQNFKPFEVDVWKTDFSPVKKFQIPNI